MPGSIENVKTKGYHDPDSRYMMIDESTDPSEPTQDHALDSEENKALLARLQDWWNRERQVQAENRIQMATDADFYDGLQWSEEDIQELRDRGQAPLVFNKIKQTVDWIIGTEKRTKVDFNAFPRKESDVETASRKTKLLKYLSDVNKTVFHRSLAFSDSVKVGVGWLEDGIHNDETDELIFSRCESWRNMWYDSLGVERDLSDSRYLFRSKWTDLDYAVASFPDRKEELEESAVSHNLYGTDEDEEFYYSMIYQQTDDQGRVVGRRSYFDDAFNADNRRERVRLVECWYRKPESVKIMRGDMQFDGNIYDENDETMNKAATEEIVSLHDSLVQRMWCAIFAGTHLLQNIRSPYKHNRFPFTPVWGYRRSRDNAPYGAVRNARDPQEDMNKRASKALFILSTNQIIADKNAVEDWDEAIDEASRPDGVIKLANSLVKFEMNTDRQLAEEHIMLMQRDDDYVMSGAGVTGENLGSETNAASGKAILAKQNEGSVVTAELFDNLRYAVQLQGEITLSLAEQFIVDRKEIRIVGERGNMNFLAMNEPEIDPVTGEVSYINDITATKADFVVDSQDFRESIRVAMFEQMMDMIGKMPGDVGLQLLDMVFELTDFPGKDEMVSRIRKINGMSAPDERETPEEKAERESREEEMRAEKELDQRDKQSVIEEREASTEDKKASALSRKVSALKAAMEAGDLAASNPEIAEAADEVLKDIGYVPVSEEEPVSV